MHNFHVLSGNFDLCLLHYCCLTLPGNLQGLKKEKKKSIPGDETQKESEDTSEVTIQSWEKNKKPEQEQDMNARRLL